MSTINNAGDDGNKKRHISAEAEAARERARDHGKFGTQNLDKSNVAVPSSSYEDEAQEEYFNESGVPMTREEFLRAFDQTKPSFVTLSYVDYDDDLTDDQARDLLAGRDMNAWESVIDGDFDYRRENAVGEAKEWCRRAGFDYDELDVDTQDEIVQRVEEMDDSDPVSDLAGNRSRLIRVPMMPYLSSLEDKYGPLYDGGSQDVYDNRVAALSTELNRRYGIDTSDPKVKRTVEALVSEGPYNWHDGVDLDVVTYGTVKDYAPESSEGAATTYEFENPHIALIDSYNGQAYEEKLPATVRIGLGTIPEKGYDRQVAPFLDNDPQRGYGLDDICGVVKSEFKPDGFRCDRVVSAETAKSIAGYHLSQKPGSNDDVIRSGFGSDDPKVREKAMKAALDRFGSEDVRMEGRKKNIEGLAWTLRAINPHISEDDAESLSIWGRETRLRAENEGSDVRDRWLIQKYRDEHGGQEPPTVMDAWSAEFDRRFSAAMNRGV